MSDQGDLFRVEYHARSTDPETSQEWAAKQSVASRARWVKELRALRDRPLNFKELAEVTGIGGELTSTDLSKLRGAGCVIDLEDDHGRKVKRGGAMLRAITQRGRDALRELDAVKDEA